MNKNAMMDICVEKKKQFFKALYKAIEGENSFYIIEVIGKITIFHKEKFIEINIELQSWNLLARTVSESLKIKLVI